MKKVCKKAKEAMNEITLSEEDEAREKRWETEDDYRTLQNMARIKKDPKRKARLLAYINEQKEDVLDDAYLAKIGLTKEA